MVEESQQVKDKQSHKPIFVTSQEKLGAPV